jgi:hypothetical protein
MVKFFLHIQTSVWDIYRVKFFLHIRFKLQCGMLTGSNYSFIFDSNFSVGCLQGQILPSNSVSARDSHIKPVFEADERGLTDNVKTNMTGCFEITHSGIFSL